MTFVEFAESMKDNQELIEKFKSCTKLEDAYAVATEHGLSIPFEQFSLYMTKISSAATELSDEDLEAISAGCDHKDTASEITLHIITGLTSMACV